MTHEHWMPEAEAVALPKAEPIDQLNEALKEAEDELDCIVCRRRRVDREIVYGIVGGRASQGLHARCAGRLQAIRPGRGIRRHKPEGDDQ